MSDPLEFWQSQPKNNRAMILNWEQEDLPTFDRSEIIATLPPLRGKRILELGAGVGRFTRTLARDAERVVAVDFVRGFLTKNRNSHKMNAKVMYLCASAEQLAFKRKAFDFVFTNWLFMYLETSQVKVLFQRIHGWLDHGGHFFLRESCEAPSTLQGSECVTVTHYRRCEFYDSLIANYFSVRESGYVQIYKRIYNNPNQLFWVCEKAS
jgi:phosphoethanolamine N-methyltransferase